MLATSGQNTQTDPPPGPPHSLSPLSATIYHLPHQACSYNGYITNNLQKRQIPPFSCSNVTRPHSSDFAIIRDQQGHIFPHSKNIYITTSAVILFHSDLCIMSEDIASTIVQHKFSLPTLHAPVVSTVIFTTLLEQHKSTILLS